MSAKPEEAESAKAPPKSKKLLIIVLAVVVLALAGAGGAWFFLSKNKAIDEDEEEVVATHHEAPKGPPTYLPIDSMVVNLADPGGEKVAQVGVTLELLDITSPEKVKPYLPVIRNGILLLISQRTAEELLQREGKEKLAAAILEDASRHFASNTGQKGEGKSKKKAGKPAADENPVRGVLFSSFIVQ